MQKAAPPGPSPAGLSGPPSSEPVSAWLASAHPSPTAVRDEWDSAAKLAMIPLGRLFDAVRIPEGVVHAATGSEEPSIIAAGLSRCLNGPVIHDPGFGRYYALVPPGTAKEWPSPLAECLTEGTFLGVPPVHRAELTELRQASYWSVPMSRAGALCRAADVLALVVAGGCRAAGDEEGES